MVVIWRGRPKRRSLDNGVNLERRTSPSQSGHMGCDDGQNERDMIELLRLLSFYFAQAQYK